MECKTYLDGGHNFRDLGNYPTEDGLRVRAGLVFRSGRLTGIKTSDLARLRQINLMAVCDLRGNQERTHHPTPWQAMGAQDYWYHNDVVALGDLRRIFQRELSTADEAHAVMLQLYRELPFVSHAAYKAVFSRIIHRQLPMVFHCTAGKDRTGVLAALLLAALGVPMPVISEDYIVTNQVANLRADTLFGVTDEAGRLTPILQAKPEYLNAMFDAVMQRCGSVSAYLTDIIGLDQKEISIMRSHLLEAATG